MLSSVTTGKRGKMKVSGKVFKIVESGGPYSSKIQFENEKEVHEVLDKDLKEASDDVE